MRDQKASSRVNDGSTNYTVYAKIIIQYANNVFWSLIGVGNLLERENVERDHYLLNSPTVDIHLIFKF